MQRHFSLLVFNFPHLRRAVKTPNKTFLAPQASAQRRGAPQKGNN
jgi:hypothetical protein